MPYKVRPAVIGCAIRPAIVGRERLGWQALFPALVDQEPPAPRRVVVESEVMEWACESSQV